MPRRERVDTPNWAIDSGEKLQRLENRLLISGLIRIIAGSSSPAYVQARWHSVDMVISSSTNKQTVMPLAEADPDASIFTTVIPRLKQKVAVLGTPISRMDEAIEDYNAYPALAYTYNGKSHAGILPDGTLLALPYDEEYYQAAMRSGRNDFEAAIGGWLPEERIFIRPDGAIVRQQNLPISKLPIRYPGTPLV